MKGYIYISRVFKTIKRAKCGGGADWLDNDPHFWNDPPTWGICRTDYRRRINEGDYVFFVLPTASKLPQMIYGYFRVRQKTTHQQAFDHAELRNKRMANKNPNGNIIVDAKGQYNRFDGGVHQDRFDEIKNYYIIGDANESEFLSEARVKKLAPDFVDVLNDIFQTKRNSAFGVITRKGRRMSEEQVHRLLTWLQKGYTEHAKEQGDK